MVIKNMQDKINIEIDKELYDNIQMLKQVIPSEEAEWEMDDNEVLKLVVWTFMAFTANEDWEDDNCYSKGWCGCSSWCDCR